MTANLNRRILLVDDNPSIHEDFRRILQPNNDAPEFHAAEEALFGAAPPTQPGARYRLDSAYQGKDAADLVRTTLAADQPYALAFVDMRMPPGWDGVRTIQELWRLDPRLQIVICTAHSDYSWDEMVGKLGRGDRLLILKKPFDTAEVLQLASGLTAKWDVTRAAEAKVHRLEAAVRERTAELETANQELAEVLGQVTEQATHDALTGLPNRLLLADRAARALAARDGMRRPVVLMLDLDQFKRVNDALGHNRGDLLLQQVARRLATILRPSDTVARFGGDEFVVMLPDGGAEAGTAVAERIGTALEAPFWLGDAEVCIEASIGIAAAGPGAEESALEELLRRADIAMFKAKADRSGYAHFETCDGGQSGHLTLIGELRQAIDCEELVLHYQPKVAVDTGDVVGVEALVRWQHPTRGLLPPSEFIALAEETTLIHRLTGTVVGMALRFCRAWLDRGVRLSVAVNVSGRSLFDPAFASSIAALVREAGVPPQLLALELTESSVMAYPELAHGILRALRDMGVRLSIDDFGTGYSSMAYLKAFPVDELKIDRSFITHMTGDPSDAALAKSAIDLGHSLGLAIVAEGVEDGATLDALGALGVDIAQGFHLGRPMTEDRFRHWLARRDGTEPRPASVPGGAPRSGAARRR